MGGEGSQWSGTKQYVQKSTASSRVEESDNLCGYGMKLLLQTSTRKQSYGRRFLGCPLWKRSDLTCGYFEWVDNEELIEVQQTTRPRIGASFTSPEIMGLNGEDNKLMKKMKKKIQMHK
ncbi:hypothetical protein CDL15_Pgr013405 [Punica granatum]|uniref:GRF-type domain-containing protein n=1 Tax=Punica granatum TaxID=22663 RepID=A0A218W140_PUNGR|nr:hypothetical protein CDL15_Pgr013405 [Punica granatum]